MKRIILASTSPRRKELLEQMGVPFEVVPSDFREELDNNQPPREVAQELALGKASVVSEHHPDAIVIGADTIVTIDGRQLAKPRNEQEAVAMLKDLGGRAHQVTTGVVVLCNRDAVRLVSSDTTLLKMRPYNAEIVADYIATGDPLDKAGSYGIQSGAAPLFEYIDGEYDTVVGLPTKVLAGLLRQVGVETVPVELILPIPKKS